MREGVDRSELAAQLQKMRERDGLADEGRLVRESPLLLRLAERLLDFEGSEERPVVPRARQLLDDALHTLAPVSQDILRAGLNWKKEPKGKDQRLTELAAEWHYSEARPLLDRERGLYLPLADALLETVEIARSRRAHQALARGDGDQAAAALFVAEQFRYYYRIFTPMGGVGSDLQAYLAFRARDPQGRLPDSLLDAALWHYAHWRLAVENFIADLGGNWIASAPDVEADIVAQFDIAQRRLPFSDWDDSQLRIALRQAADSEFVPFIANLRAARLHARYRRRLKTWVLRCDCSLRRPKRQCEPHQVIGATRRFTVLIDQEWYRLAQWYHLPPDTVSAEREDVLHYFLHAEPDNYDLARLDRSE